jgi:hypothetical protein
MKRLGQILAIGTLMALPLAAVAIPTQPARAFGVYIGARPAYGCGPYACGYYGPPAGVQIGGGWHHHWHRW